MQVLKALPPLSDLPKVLRDAVVSLVHDPDQLPEYPRCDVQSICATRKKSGCSSARQVTASKSDPVQSDANMSSVRN